MRTKLKYQYRKLIKFGYLQAARLILQLLQHGSVYVYDADGAPRMEVLNRNYP